MLRKLLLVMAGVALLLAGTRVATMDAAEREAEQEVLKVEEELDRAFAEGDTATLDRIWADDVVYTSANGRVLDKAQYLARFRSGTRTFDSFAHDDIRVRLYENMAIVTGRSTSVLHDAGRLSAGPRRFTHIYVKRGGRWRLVAHQVTDIAKP
jgi:ketosteroid isomerase-like protein